MSVKTEVLKPQNGNGNMFPFPIPKQAPDNPVSNALAVRQSQEVQVAVLMAKLHPRDEAESFERIIKACRCLQLAEKAMWKFPRGKGENRKDLTGPTIILAKMVARNWGNIEYGTVELYSTETETTIQAFCWDLQTLTKQTRTFTVRHIRRAAGRNHNLEDPRDIYENNMSLASRRVRSCILDIVPKHIVDAAIEECLRTQEAADDESRPERIQRMVASWAEMGVSKDQLEGYLGHHAEACSEAEIIKLRHAMMAILDGHARVSDFFNVKSQGSGEAYAPPPKKTEPEPKKPRQPEPEVKTVTRETLDEFLVRHGIEIEDALAQFRGEVGWLKDGDGLERLTVQQDQYVRDNVEMLKDAIEEAKTGGVR